MCPECKLIMVYSVSLETVKCISLGCENRDIEYKVPTITLNEVKSINNTGGKNG